MYLYFAIVASAKELDICSSYAMFWSEIPWNSAKRHLYFPYTREPLASVHTKKTQVTSGMFHGIPRENIAWVLYPTLCQQSY